MRNLRKLYNKNKGWFVIKKFILTIVAICGIVFIVDDAQAEANSITMEATYYTAECSGCSGITASGYDVRGTIYADGYRVIAVDPWMIPLGTLVWVDTPYESFMAIAADTGGAINGHRVDILVGSYYEAINKGRHYVTVTPLY